MVNVLNSGVSGPGFLPQLGTLSICAVLLIGH